MRRFAELRAQLERRNPAARKGALAVEVPLRVCPLGAHVDHQGGAVTGMTVDRSVTLIAVPSGDGRVRVSSLDFSGGVEVPLEGAVGVRDATWGDYVRAAIAVLRSERRLEQGLDAVICGDLPGTGLSSSAAVLVAYLLALAEVNDIELDPARTANLVQRAENDYIGLSIGLLDPSVMLFAEFGSLTHIRCSDFTVGNIALPESAPSFRVVVAFSGASRMLVATGYNNRVDECREAARLLLEAAGEDDRQGAVLGDVSPESHVEHRDRLPAALRRRADHFFGEKGRVAQGVEAWGRGDLASFGRLMTASGESSISNFESGTPPLITLHELLRDASGTMGVRFSGAGFGGSCVALVEKDAASDIIAEVAAEYRAAHPDLAANASFDSCRPSGPARVFRP